MEAPIFSSSSMTRMWFFLQAMCKGVKPFCSPTQRETDKQGAYLRRPKENPNHLADEKESLGPSPSVVPTNWKWQEACTTHQAWPKTCCLHSFFFFFNLVVFLDALKEPAVSSFLEGKFTMKRELL